MVDNNCIITQRITLLIYPDVRPCTKPYYYYGTFYDNAPTTFPHNVLKENQVRSRDVQIVMRDV